PRPPAGRPPGSRRGLGARPRTPFDAGGGSRLVRGTPGRSSAPTDALTGVLDLWDAPLLHSRWIEMRKVKVAVAGATGAVGREMLKVLEERDFPVAELVPLASERSAGKKIEFKGQEITVRRLAPDSFEGRSEEH